MSLKKVLKDGICLAVEELYGVQINENQIQIQKTRKEFVGDYTINVFPITNLVKKAPEQAANEIGSFLDKRYSEIDSFNVIKGFLNIAVSDNYWLSFVSENYTDENIGTIPKQENAPRVMIEYSSPNTNKPLHLGHIRNNLLGYSIAKIMEANGYDVIKVNLVNDRGIHICKSMLAWQKWGNGETPESSGKKGDKLVGEYYVKFDSEYKKEVEVLVNKVVVEDTDPVEPPLMIEAREMLRKWESGDSNICKLWSDMNAWVYKGFDETYKKLGVEFDKIYYESETYKLGRSIVFKGIEDGFLNQREDGSVWADLSDQKLDQKLLLRADGTSVYMTQDIGTAELRFNEFKPGKMIYVVGNEQDYHFNVLKIVLGKLGYNWSESIQHFSYGMVELPHGKMKSREGTVVDADDLIDEMIYAAGQMAAESIKLENLTDQEKAEIFRITGLGALKYFILKVDPRKNMMFNPEESVNLQGNTAPFIQYSYARTQSLLRNAAERNIPIPVVFNKKPMINEKVKELIKFIYRFQETVAEAGNELSPALIANYAYDLAKEYNQFWYDHKVLVQEDVDIRELWLVVSIMVGKVLKSSLSMLGIEVPDRM